MMNLEFKTKRELYQDIYMKEMNLNYLNVTKEDYILMETILDSCLKVEMNKKEFKEFINKIVKNKMYMDNIKGNVGGNSE
jgi:DNA-binding Xre family transcriptional regulator